MPHHIIWDGWSFDLLYAEMSALYGALAARAARRLPELPVSYGDFAAWHREWMQGPEYAAQLAFWRERLGAPNAARANARRRCRPTCRAGRGMSGSSKSRRRSLVRRTAESLHATALGRSTHAVHDPADGVLRADERASAGQRDLVVGTPVRGRNSDEVEQLMGYFTNLLPLRVEIDPRARSPRRCAGVQARWCSTASPIPTSASRTWCAN